MSLLGDGLIPARSWIRSRPPRRILLIRLQALGDLVITLPYARTVRERLSEAEVELLTREEFVEVGRAAAIFHGVHAIGGGRVERWQLPYATALLPRLLRRRFEMVVDLQNNRVSRYVRRLLRPEAWSGFDRVSALSAGERTRRTLEAAGLRLGDVRAGLPLRDPEAGLPLLQAAGWAPAESLVVLNPAGAFTSRNWPLDSYAAFAHLWRRRFGGRFLILGFGSLRPKADLLKARLGQDLIDLVGRTSVAEALALVQRARLVLTEDSGLMHMAWAAGVPTLALFGSSRADWSRPLGNALCLHSGDLECGACLQAECRYGDVHCLTRYTPEHVFREAESLVARSNSREPIITA